MVPGRAEAIEKYFETIADLRRRGLHVLAIDLRGQGGSQRLLSDPRKGHVDDFDDYVTDIDAAVAQVLTPMPKPHFALAHSMGAAALLLALERGRAPIERAVLLAPLVGLRHLAFPRLAEAAAVALDFIALGASYIPGGGATSISTKRFQGNLLTSDPVRYARAAEVFATHPQLAIGDPTIRWTHAMFDVIAALPRSRFRAPARHADADGAARRRPALLNAGGGGAGGRLRGCQMILVPGAKHELLTEADAYRSQFLAAFDAFIPGETAMPAEVSVA